MFQSATLKLTGWYLLILTIISLIFSVAIFTIASNEITERLNQLQIKFEGAREYPIGIALPERVGYGALREAQGEEAKRNLFIQLLYVNIVLLAAGGAGSYFLARRTLRPIEASHEAQLRFVSDASHELKTPLTVMQTEIEVGLKNKNLTLEETKTLLESNLEEVVKLSTLSATLLQLAQLDNIELEKEPIILGSLVEEVIKKYDPTGKRLAFANSSKQAAVFANRASTEELITILIDNALKYSPAESTVRITTQRMAKGVKLKVTNAGAGIDPDDLPHIFDRFYRADTARTKNKQVAGHGLGLSLAKRIIEQHQGELQATSSPGGNTTFIAILPCPPSES